MTPLYTAALALVVPARRGAGRIYDVLTDAERWLALRVRRARDAASRKAWPLFTALALLMLGCHSQAPARTALAVAADALHATDATVAVVYTARASASLEASLSLADYRERMAPLDAAHDALVLSAALLLAAQATLDGADDRSFGHGFRCALDALTAVRAALVTVGIPEPPEIARAVSLLSPLSFGECPREPRSP